MKRNILEDIIKWKERHNRKPLILNGTGQVGETYILQELGRLCYKNVAYMNCDRNDTRRNIFANDYDTYFLSNRSLLNNPFLYEFSRISRIYPPRLRIFHHDSTGTNNGTFAYVDSGTDESIGTYPRLTAYVYFRFQQR